VLLFVFLPGMVACSGKSERLSSGTATLENKTPDGTIVIDETRIMWLSVANSRPAIH
jgi:hypothetical protein